MIKSKWYLISALYYLCDWHFSKVKLSWRHIQSNILIQCTNKVEPTNKELCKIYLVLCFPCFGSTFGWVFEFLLLVDLKTSTIRCSQIKSEESFQITSDKILNLSKYFLHNCILLMIYKEDKNYFNRFKVHDTLRIHIFCV